jgi:hypothetical protein
VSTSAAPGRRRRCSLDPRSLNARYHLSRALAVSSRVRETVEQFEQALRIAPATPTPPGAFGAEGATPRSKLISQ